MNSNLIAKGFNSKGANTSMDHTPPPRADDGPKLDRDSRYPSMIQNGLSGVHSNDGGDSGSPPNLKGAFQFGLPQNYPWGYAQEFYTKVPADTAPQGRDDIYKSVTGRMFTEHAIETTYPHGTSDKARSISPANIEYVIAYGQERTISNNRGNFTLGDVTVGVSEGGKLIHTAIYGRKQP